MRIYDFLSIQQLYIAPMPLKWLLVECMHSYPCNNKEPTSKYPLIEVITISLMALVFECGIFLLLQTYNVLFSHYYDNTP